MPDVKPPEIKPPKEPGKIYNFFAAIFSAPKKLLGLSLAARAAIVVSVVLIAIVITAWVVFLNDPASVPWRHSMSAGRIIAVICLLIAIPLVVYRGLKLWIEGEGSRFPDIDFAWKAGIAALQRNGLDIGSIPVFLILGSSSERQEKALLDASGLGLRIQGIPEGPAALHWYANPDGVYLFCTQASWLGALAAYQDKRKLEALAAGLTDLDGPGPLESADVSETPVMPMIGAAPAAPAPRPAPAVAARAPAPSQQDQNRGTMMLDAYVPALTSAMQPGNEPSEAAPAMARAAPGRPDESANRGTMMLQAPFDPSQYATVAPLPAAAPAQMAPAPMTPMPSFTRSSYSSRQTVLLSPQESADAMQRLQYVCQLLRRARSPLCAVNGILTLLPLESVQGGNRQVEELQRAIKSDLKTVQRALELRCPVTALVVGLEEESGFRELVRRVGRQRALVQRFGQRFDVRSLPTPQELVALCSHVCGAFEDWVYTLFREKEALTRPGNTRLYGLLCKVRCSLKSRLAEVLAGGFGYDPQHEAGVEPLLFSGCYFAATGATEDRQAFVKGVFDKLSEEQEEIEWTERAMNGDRRLLWTAYVGFAADALLVMALVGMFIARLLK